VWLKLSPAPEQAPLLMAATVRWIRPAVHQYWCGAEFSVDTDYRLDALIGRALSTELHLRGVTT
jgi:hypothetical protein